MLLHHCTWAEVEAYLAARRDIVVPIGSTEQHGPTGLLGTDALCPEAICRRTAEDDGVLVGPTLPLGNAQHHLAFAGTISVKPTTFIALLVDTVASLAHHGFERVLFVNGHGGNIGPAYAAFSEIQGKVTLEGHAPVRTQLHNWWEGPRVDALLKELFGDADGLHATCGEISLTQAIDPSTIKRVDVDGKGPAGETFYDAEDFRRRYPDGRMGSDPSLCSPEHGERIWRAAADDLRAVLGADD